MFPYVKIQDFCIYQIPAPRTGILVKLFLDKLLLMLLTVFANKTHHINVVRQPLHGDVHLI
jgi:hypothetical protein